MAHKVLERQPADEQGHSSPKESIKMVSAIIRPEKLDVIREALTKLNLVGGVTLTEVRGSGHQRGSILHNMGSRYTTRYLDKVKIEMAVSHHDLVRVQTLIRELAHTGHVGDGLIFVTDVIATVRIRTGERGIGAL